MGKTHIIAVDFDGTIVDHVFPDIGRPVPGAFEWLKVFQFHGAKLILWTMRSDGDKHGPVLTQAIDFCRQNGVEFFAHNQNPDQLEWSTSNKAYAHMYIDDAAIGCPLRQNPRMGGRPYVDWDIVGESVMLILESHLCQQFKNGDKVLFRPRWEGDIDKNEYTVSSQDGDLVVLHEMPAGTRWQSRRLELAKP